MTRPGNHPGATPVPGALHAIDQQKRCVALDLTPQRPTLYLSSAAGVSVARVLEGISAVDPNGCAWSTPTRSPPPTQAA